MAITDLRSGDVWAEYQYLKGRIDIGAKLERNVLEWEANGVEVQQYSKNTVMLGASLPFNTKTRFSVSPFYTLTSFESQPFIAGQNPVLPDGNTNHFGGVSLELVMIIRSLTA